MKTADTAINGVETFDKSAELHWSVVQVEQCSKFLPLIPVLMISHGSLSMKVHPRTILFCPPIKFVIELIID